MKFSFGGAESYLLTSESVTEGHPDKLCDQISDAVLDAILAQDPEGRVACETAITNGLVVVMGEITTDCYVDIPAVVRKTIKTVGYTDSSYGLEYNSCGVIVALQEQSKDIALGVDTSMEVKKTPAQKADKNASSTLNMGGAGDQGMMVGFACRDTEEMMPLPIALAHRLCKRLSQVRKEGLIPYLRPDGKSQVTIEYAQGVPKRVHTIVLSAQHSPEIEQGIIHHDLMELVIKEEIPEGLLDADTLFLINPTGRFVTGGPMADTGLTGRKIQVDTYGAAARHGGGAFSGKDPTKVDRSAAYAARYVAKNLVASGLVDRVEIQLSYAIGVAHPISISIETFGTGKVEDAVLEALVHENFDLRPDGIIQSLSLARPIYQATACYGHFGRKDLDLPWESTDKATILRAKAGFPPRGD